jgi:hypothetical protein
MRLLRGDGVERNSYQAIEWMRKAGDGGHLPAQVALGRMYLTGVEEMGADPAEAEAWLAAPPPRRPGIPEAAQGGPGGQAGRAAPLPDPSTPTANPGAAGTTARRITGLELVRLESALTRSGLPDLRFSSTLFLASPLFMSKTTSALRWVAIATSLTLAGCVTPGGGTISTGTAPTAATGAAGGASSVNANPTLERCDAPLGTLAVDDGRGKEWYASFGAATKITTIEPLIRLAVQQSNCFVITSSATTAPKARCRRSPTSSAIPVNSAPAPSSKRASAWRPTTTWSRRSSSTTTPPASWPRAWAACSAAWAP